MMNIREENGFRYIDEGKGPVLLLLHGLFGALSNFHNVTDYFSKHYRVLVPVLPIYELPMRNAGLELLVKHIEDFVRSQGLTDMIVLGNSLGGHLGLMYTLANPDKVSRLILTGSSGLFENGMGGSYPRRGDYAYVKERVEYTFYDPKVASEELIKEVFDITNSIPKCMQIVAIAKSAQRHNMAGVIQAIKVPTLLIWGLNDTITPPTVAHEFHRLIPRSELRFIDECCHAPMMEHPGLFNRYVDDFLARHQAA